jgi:hypothetical protein
MLCKISDFHHGDHEECRVQGYKNPVRTPHVTHYVSATELSRLILCKIEIFLTLTVKNAVLWYMTPCGSSKNRCFGVTHRVHHQGGKNKRARKEVRNN